MQAQGPTARCEVLAVGCPHKQGPAASKALMLRWPPPGTAFEPVARKSLLLPAWPLACRTVQLYSQLSSHDAHKRGQSGAAD